MFTRKFYSNSCRHTNIDTKIIFMVYTYIQVCACIIPMHVLQNTLIQSVYNLKTDTSGIQAKMLAMDYKTLPERTIYIYMYIYIYHTQVIQLFCSHFRLLMKNSLYVCVFLCRDVYVYMVTCVMSIWYTMVIQTETNFQTICCYVTRLIIRKDTKITLNRQFFM